MEYNKQIQINFDFQIIKISDDGTKYFILTNVCVHCGPLVTDQLER